MLKAGLLAPDADRGGGAMASPAGSDIGSSEFGDPDDAFASQSASDQAEGVTRAKEDLRSVLVAFAGLRFIALIPGISTPSPLAEGVVDGLTLRNMPGVVAALQTWQNAHPFDAFEVAILVARLEGLMSALAASSAPAGQPARSKNCLRAMAEFRGEASRRGR